MRGAAGYAIGLAVAALGLLLAGCRTAEPRKTASAAPVLPPAALPSGEAIGTAAPFWLRAVAPDGRWLVVDLERGRALGRPPMGALAVDSQGRTLHLDGPPGTVIGPARWRDPSGTVPPAP
ncbi:hypothetical protein [Pyxidicoccus xibeiensis]|uniref:hypothetical protein n=1 Tax=Pyxidicoccus xibeiensis TaxID=2906759 RepID=UPI0020A6F51C|nr:hypothetical protein [Pyxidicoccus xibeiensis]MCP3137763.1 hypothetical protein [Pyxidicoccus xibeiensis]